MHEVIVFSKEGCHICEGVEAKVKALVQKSKEQGRGDFSLRVVDIRNDESIFKKYFLTIPVVRVDGIDIFSAEDIALVADRDKKLEAYFSKLR